MATSVAHFRSAILLNRFDNIFEDFSHIDLLHLSRRIWKNSLENKAKAIEDYKSALKLAYTRSIPEIYETANVKFDFTEKHIKQLAEFIENKLAELELTK